MAGRSDGRAAPSAAPQSDPAPGKSRLQVQAGPGRVDVRFSGWLACDGQFRLHSSRNGHAISVGVTDENSSAQRTACVGPTELHTTVDRLAPGTYTISFDPGPGYATLRATARVEQKMRGDSAPSWKKPVAIVTGVSIAGLSPGMRRVEVEARGFKLVPEGVARADRTGWKTGPLLLLFDHQGRLALISLTVNKTAGLSVDGRIVPPRATLEQIARILPRCKLHPGSGGRELRCRAGTGKKTMSFYDRGATVWLHLP